MRYISTRGQAPALNFGEAMLTGLARDGGLYVPEKIPTLTRAEIADLAGRSYEDVAFRIMQPFVAETFTDTELQQAITRAYAGFGHVARAPLVQLAPGHFLLELFHGPTLAFKDFAMQVIGQLFQIALAKEGRRITIVGATSGDTGSAAIEAFRGLDNVDVFILFPHGRVSEVQRRQMTTPDESNVHALALDGDFDDCQARLKDMFNHFEIRDAVGLAGVNSINWARDLAQVYAPERATTSERQIAAYKRMPDSVLFRVQKVRVKIDEFDLPGPTRRKVACTRCGQVIRDAREILLQGNPVCKPCTDRSYFTHARDIAWHDMGWSPCRNQDNPSSTQSAHEPVGSSVDTK